MNDPVREALLDVWRQLYQVQVLIVAMDPELLEQIDVAVGLLQYRVRIAKRRSKPFTPRVRRLPMTA